jgi:uncharacterized protein YgbK (DUF1537 family)
MLLKGNIRNVDFMIVVADDLTGANDTAIQFAKYGLSTLVLTQFTDQLNHDQLKKYDIISVNTNSRMLAAENAYGLVRSIAAELKKSINDSQVYKKIDSVLRGNPGIELEVVLDEWDISLALVAPSYPANKSVVENGMLISGSARIDAVALYTKEMRHTVECVPFEIVRQGKEALQKHIEKCHNQGSQVFIIDAVCDEDLHIILGASRLIKKPHVLSGSAGLAQPLAGNMLGSGKRNAPVREGDSSFSPVLFVAGTRQHETARQILRASKAGGGPVITIPLELIRKGRENAVTEKVLAEVKKQREANHDICLVAVDSMFKSGTPAGGVEKETEDGEFFAQVLGRIVKKILSCNTFPVLITTGGDTSLGVCKSLGVTGIEPVEEIYPGVPFGRMIGGLFDGQLIITKSGRFGDEDCLVRIINYLGIKMEGKNL